VWASTQRDLGYVIDTLIRTVPIRTRVVTRPGLLAEDMAAGATELRLLSAGEPTLPISLLHLEATDGFHDRHIAGIVTKNADAKVDLVGRRVPGEPEEHGFDRIVDVVF